MTKTIFACMVAIALPTVTSASEFDELLGNIPLGANAALAIDVEKALASPMARKNNWNKRMNDGTAPVYLPQEADKVIVAAQIDPVQDFAMTWEAAVMGLTESLPMRLVAKSEGGYTDTIGGLNAAWVPSDAYFIEIEPKVMGLMHPANRQLVSRWARRQEKKRASEVSDYLARGISRVKKGPQFVLALDLQDAVQPHRVHQRLAESEVVQKHKLNVDDLADVMSSLRGVIVEITVTDKAVAKVQIDFDKTVTFNERVAKELILGALTTFQAELPGAEKWDVTAGGQYVFAKGDVGPAAFRRILSMLEIPSTKFSSLKGQDTETSSGDDMERNSLAYFKSITQLIDELQQTSRSHMNDAHWMDKYGKKIDRLPILHVDPDLLDFGQKVGQTLGMMSGARKGANLRAGVEQGGILANAGSGYGGRGYGGYSYGYRGNGYRSRRQAAGSAITAGIVAKERNTAIGTATKLQGFQLISQATTEMRRTMTERYNVAF